MPFVRQIVFVLMLICSFAVVAEPRPYIVDVPTSAAESGYFSDLLGLVLNASKAPDEIIQIRFAQEQLSQARWIAAVAQGRGNSIIWTMTSKTREETLRPIRFPLMKGLMGYRVLVIRKGEQAMFADVKTQQDLAKLSAGQGMHWPDTGILRTNGFRVVEATAKENLYKMLAAKRFDFFPRGISEVQLERDLIDAQKLQVEPRILLHYPTDLYFFVGKNNHELAARIERGWLTLLKNGEFDRFFLRYEPMRLALDSLHKHERHIIELDNPFISDETISASKPYWIDPNETPAH